MLTLFFSCFDIAKLQKYQDYKFYQRMNKSFEVHHVSKWLQKQRHVWVKALPQYPNPDEDAFLEAKVLEIEGKQLTIQLINADGKVVKAPIENVMKLTYGPNDVADMVDLEQLNEPQLLYNIKRRYVNDLIFTYCGPTLVIINPYTFIEKLFNDNLLQEYQTMVFTDNLQYKSLPPHVFALAAFCLWQLFDNGRNQSIVISGQSGAGKTENTKYCLKFLASLGRNMKELVTDSSKMSYQPNKSQKKINYQNMRVVQKTLKKTNSKIFGIQQKILGCNQILQAFGNSKTIRNDNSSRFGKLILLVYGETQIDIKSAFIISYLLEKSRIVSVSDGERNYHIFYYFCKGTTPQEKQKYKLNDQITNYYYLNQSKTYDLPKCSDEDKFHEIKKEFEMYITPQQTDCVYRILSIVLNAGNITFLKGQNKNNEETVTIMNEKYIKNVADLLQVDYEAFKHCFQNRTRKQTGGKVVTSPLKYVQAIALRDSFAKNVYEKVFNFLVCKLNEKIQIEKIDFDTSSRQKRKSIGLLDIFGFQVLLINSLEQFFINFANQKLQQLYVSYIFKEQQNEFLKQGLQQFSHDIGFQDNKPIIDLFEEAPVGIFNLINESSSLLVSSDENIPSNIAKNHKTNPFFIIPQLKKGTFQINHSCSPVIYTVNGFTSKNKDQFPQQLLQIIKTTKNQELKKIVVGVPKEPDPKAKKSNAPKFLGSKFLVEMNKLTQQLYSCDCHFVRCIKPNSKKAPKLFNSEAVLQSLRYLGVLDSIKIRKLGYIYRRPYKQFYKKFYEVERYIYSYNADIRDKTEENFKQMSRQLLQKIAKKQLDCKDILFGAKKILIKQSALNHLQLLVKEKKRLRIQVINRFKLVCKNSIFRTRVKEFLRIIAIQKMLLHKFVKKVREKILNRKIIRVQNVIKKYLWHLRLEKIKVQATKSVTRISSYYKMKRQRRWFLDVRKNVKRLQAITRSFLSMNKFFKQKMCLSIIKDVINKSWAIVRAHKALIIQKHWKGYKVRKLLKQVLKSMKMRVFIKRSILKFRIQAFSQMLNIFRKPVIKLQAVVRGRYHRRTFLQLKKSTIFIQKAYRRHLRKRFYLLRIWEKSYEQLVTTEKQKLKQCSLLGISYLQKMQQNVKTKLYQTTAMVQKVFPQQLRSHFLPQIEQEAKDLKINQTITFSDKNTMQTYIIDLDIVSTLSYKGHWMQKYIALKSQLSKKQEYPLKIDISEYITCVVTNKDRVYSFGSHSEDLEHSRIQLKSYPHSLCVNDESVYVVNKDMELYEWGDNTFGQLFSQTSLKTVRLSYNNSVSSARDVECRGRSLYYVDFDGKVYNKNEAKVQIVKFTRKVPISCVVSGYNFTHFLTTTGQLYSFGCNQFGQLGIDTKQSKIIQPTINQYFILKKQAIESISAGIGHSIAKSKLGYVYTWGDNRYGQVSSLIANSYIKVPVSMQVDRQKVKALQCAAGFRCSYILMQTLVIVGMGTSHGICTYGKSVPFVSIDLLSITNSNSKNLIPIKISTTWNRQMSLLTVNCLQQNKCKPGTKQDVMLKYCKIIAKEWPFKAVYPEYAEWMDNILNLSDMRKFKFQKNVAPKAKSSFTGKKAGDSQIQQLKILMDLRKTSNLFKNAAKLMINQINQRLSAKLQIKWSADEIQLYNYVQECSKIILK